MQTKKISVSKQKTIISDKISSNCTIFSLYGTQIDQYIEGLMTYRAIDQTSTVNTITKSIFKDIFKPSSAPKFNFMIKVKKKIEWDKIEKKFGDSINISELKSLNPDKNPTYYKKEIDGAILVNLTSKPVDIDKRDGYAFIEIKLFTAPTDKKGQILTRHLQKKPLSEYFKVRNIFGLIGFSYLQEKNSIAPVTKNDIKLKSIDVPYLWCIHLILMDDGVLNDEQNAVQRASRILSAIDIHNKKILPKKLCQKGYKFGLIYNLVKVIKMSQYIVELKNELKEEKKRAEEEKLRAEEEKLRAEEEKLRADKYRQKLINMRIDPDK